MLFWQQSNCLAVSGQGNGALSLAYDWFSVQSTPRADVANRPKVSLSNRTKSPGFLHMSPSTVSKLLSSAESNEFE